MYATDIPSTLKECYDLLDQNILPKLLPMRAFKKHKEKVIHDNLMESCYFTGWEVALLDTPLLQRLRHIHQLGTAFLTYPSAVHTRFSHTLGVATLAGALYDNLAGKQYLQKGAHSDQVRKNEKAVVRLAGLLHDIGHTFFSHCSEMVVKPFWDKILFEAKLFRKNPKPHEFIGYLIVTSEYFSKYWCECVRPEEYGIEIDLHHVAAAIVGEYISEDKAYLTEIINGHYDVDKLEYLNRDAKTAGLPITYDKARYFQKIDIFEDKGKASLVMGQGGIQCVEQMALGKIMLFPYVYQHHKVLTADTVVQDIVRKLLDKDQIINSMHISHPLDMLLYTDDDILGYSVKTKDMDLQLLLDQLKSRSLPKRAFVFHREYLREDHDSKGRTEQKIVHFLKILKVPDQLKDLRIEIARALSDEHRSVSYHEILITRPSFFNGFSAMNSAPILTKSNICVPVDMLWLLSGWSDTHDNKTDYVYFHVPEDLGDKAFELVKEMLLGKYGFEFKEDRVREHCKLSA